MSAQELSPPAADAEDLGARTARAAGWRLAATLAASVSRFLVGVLLSRLLTPSDFGVTAIAFVVLGFVQPLQDLGIGAAVVQRRHLTSRHVRAAFTFTTLLGLATAAAIMLVAPLVAIVMRDARVTPVLRVLSAGLALQAPGGVAGALLRRRLDFRRVFFVDTASYMVGFGVSIGLALLGKGVWSLVWGGFVQGTLLSAFQLAVVRHSVRPLLTTRETRDLLHFGVGWGASNWINYLALNADNFVVGRMLGAASLGLYARAYTLMSLPSTHMASLLSGVLFPAFAEIQADRARLRRAYLVITQLIAIVAAASMATMVIVAPHLVRSRCAPADSLWSRVFPRLVSRRERSRPERRASVPRSAPSGALRDARRHRCPCRIGLRPPRSCGRRQLSDSRDVCRHWPARALDNRVPMAHVRPGSAERAGHRRCHGFVCACSANAARTKAPHERRYCCRHARLGRAAVDVGRAVEAGRSRPSAIESAPSALVQHGCGVRSSSFRVAVLTLFRPRKFGPGPEQSCLNCRRNAPSGRISYNSGMSRKRTKCIVLRSIVVL